MASLEEVSQYTLDEADRERLFALQRVCSVCWTTNEGWPVGVTHRYLWARGRIWVTTSAQRHRVHALRRRPESCVIISGDGTELGPDRTVTLKTRCTIHQDRETLEWFYEAFSRALHPENAAAQQGLAAMLDTPRRVVLELAPVKIISYDGSKLAEAIAREGVTGAE
jgi:general stress protein 26